MDDTFLNIKNLTKSYGSTQVLKGINLTIKKGEILSLLGVNGAGKTTLSSIIATLHPATSGDIEYNGVSIYKDIPAFRRTLGYCPQAPNLNPALTLEQNLLYACRYYNVPQHEIQQRVNEVVEQFELSKYLQQKAHVLSGGYKQRFMIARSMIHRPEFIILDEPTVGLDPHIRRNLWSIIKNLKQQGITVLLTTHYLDEAEKLSDRVCILDRGQIKLIDTPDKLLADFQQQNLEDVFVELMKTEKE
jgi:ABC-2 type transport system ATP-binding protein